ncbi:MAG: aldehyde dehydrogenase family protein, partial [Bacteroidia bacterium]|nr:aldehyde dehydrogenase family protein [Bacteroidia bacterium]
MKKIDVINPATQEKVRSYDQMSFSEAKKVIHKTQQSWLEWRNTSFAYRAERLREAAQILRGRQEPYARLMTEEMGKIHSQGRAEIEKCANTCDYYAEHGANFLAPENIATDARHSFVSFQPLGIILAVMPWNFPFWQVLRFATPALMAGNVCLLKHASNVPGCALAIEDVFRDAGFPEHAFRALLLSGSQVAEVIEDPRIQAVTLTGSTPAGQAVAAKAGEMLKKTVLELGGSDPYIVL